MGDGGVVITSAEFEKEVHIVVRIDKAANWRTRGPHFDRFALLVR
jgi:hypothetical protein